MATKLEGWSYRQFKTALDAQYNAALANLAADGLASANWIDNSFINESYTRVWENVSLYSGKKANRAMIGVSGIVEDAWKSNVANYINSKNYGRVEEIHAYSERLYTQAVNDAIQTATNEGLGVEATQRRIRQLVNGKLKGDINIWRARRIAQTETISALNYGTYKAGADAIDSDGADIVKVWRVGYSGPDPRHGTYPGLDGQVRERGTPFDVGGTALNLPGDVTGPASEVINCQCNLQWVSRQRAAEVYGYM